MSIAIDFGTSNTVITRWNRLTEQSEIIKLPSVAQQIEKNPPLIPSLIYVENAEQNQVVIGQEVRERGLDVTDDPRFFRAFKRGIGATIQGFLPELDGRIVTFERVGEWFLSEIIQQLEPKPESLILTVPVDSFENYRHWLTQVCQNWQIEQVRLVDEPTAAALGYGSEGNSLVLVVDFGGGTFDLSLVQLNWQENQPPQGFILKWGDKLFGKDSAQKTKLAKVIAKAGKNLGGSDLDGWLLDYFAQNQGIPKSTLTSRLVEKLKIQLSSQMEAGEVYFNDLTLDACELSLNRAQFEAILQEHQFFEQLDELIASVLQQGRRNGVESGDIDAVLLVGGSGQIPSVQNWLRQYFEPAKIKGDRPFDAVARGALQLSRGLEVKDFLYHSYGIRYWNRRKQCHGWQTIIPPGQPYPMERPVELILGASVENQPSIELVVGELGSETTSTEVYFDGDRLVTRNLTGGQTSVRPLNDREGARSIAPLNPRGNPGSDRIKVSFWVDGGRFLRIAVADLLTNEILLDNQVVARLS